MSNNNTFYGHSKISGFLKGKSKHIYFLGIGGVGMYSLVMLAAEEGFTVSGSDREEGEYTRILRSKGIPVKIGYDPAGISSSSLVVYSLAVDSKARELEYARTLGIKTVSRADFLSYLMKSYARTIGVCGSHGKSTATAMLAAIFSKAEKRPTVSIGAPLVDGEPALIGEREYLVYESCEYRDSFLATSPDVIAVTNIELDHTDYFESEDAIIASFRRAINSAGELAVLNIDDKNTRKIINEIHTPTVTYGASQGADYRYTIDSFTDRGTDFSVYKRGRGAVKFKLNIPGVYNVSNALLAISVARELGINDANIREALSDFVAPGRRLERLGAFLGREVYYDYAHHPTEISAAINAVRTWYSDKVTVIFKPHTYSRTKALWDGFVSSLSMADYVIVTDIYAAREEEIPGISAKKLADDLECNAVYAPDYEVKECLKDTLGAIIVMGAGNLNSVLASIIPKEDL